MKIPVRKPADTYELQPNKDFETEAELKRYAAERKATVKKIWKVEVYRCVLIMPCKHQEK